MYDNAILKQWFLLLVVCVLFSIMSIPGIAQAGYSDNVKDYLDYLSAEELHDVQSKINEAIHAYDLDIVIVITKDTEGKSSMDYADDYFDYNNFGIGSDASGLLMLINMDIREVWISTTGRAIDIFTDNRIEQVLDAIYPYLADDNYYHACSEFISQVERYAGMGVPDGQYRQDVVTTYTYWEKAVRLIKTPIAYIIAIIVSVAATLIASSGNKGKVTVSNRTYEEGGSFRLIDKKDEFINQTVTRVRITNNNSSQSSSGRSSVHRGSSGKSHGGGGRKF